MGPSAFKDVTGCPNGLLDSPFSLSPSAACWDSCLIIRCRWGYVLYLVKRTTFPADIKQNQHLVEQSITKYHSLHIREHRKHPSPHQLLTNTTSSTKTMQPTTILLTLSLALFTHAAPQGTPVADGTPAIPTSQLGPANPPQCMAVAKNIPTCGVRPSPFSPSLSSKPPPDPHKHHLILTIHFPSSAAWKPPNNP